MIELFYTGAGIAIVATALAISRANVVHALLYLITSLLAVAVVMYSLGAPFVAALEVMVYAGAIMVFFVFVVMLLNLGPGSAEGEQQWLRPSFWIGPGLLAGGLAIQMLLSFGSLQGAAAVAEVSPKQVGMALFGPYLLAVELASMLLLAGLVSAYHLGKSR